MESCRIELPHGVHFEVPRDYAVFCRGRPVRVLDIASVENGIFVVDVGDSLSFAHGPDLVEYDLGALRGLIVNRNEEVSGAIACTLRVAFFAEPGETSLLPLLSANPSRVDAFDGVVSRLRKCDLPVSIYSSLAELTSA